MKSRIIIILVLLLSCTYSFAQSEFEVDVQKLDEYVRDIDTLQINVMHDKYKRIYERVVKDPVRFRDDILQSAFIYAITCEVKMLWDEELSVSKTAYDIAIQYSPKAYDYLFIISGRIASSSSNLHKFDEAKYYAEKSLYYAKKLDDNSNGYYSIALYQCSIVNLELGEIDKAYKQIVEAYNKIDATSSYVTAICDTYINTLVKKAESVASKRKSADILKYYYEAQSVVDKYPNLVVASALEETFYDKCIIQCIRNNNNDGACNIAKARALAQRTAYDKYNSDKDPDYIGEKDYYVQMSITNASKAYDSGMEDVHDIYVQAAYQFSLDEGVSVPIKSYALSWYASYVGIAKGDFNKAIDLSWKRFQFDEGYANLSTLENDLKDIFYYADIATTYIRYFYKNPLRNEETKTYVPIVSENDTRHILDMCSMICSYVSDKYGANIYNTVATEYKDLPDNYRVFPVFSKEDISLMKAHCAVYYKDYSSFDNILESLLSTNIFDDNKLIDLIWRVDNNLFLNYDYTSACLFLEHIKERPQIKERKEVLAWIDNEVPYLGDWVNQQTILAQQKSGEEGDIDGAVNIYKNILSQIEKTSGHNNEYVGTLCSMGVDLCLSKRFDDAIDYLSQADVLSSDICPNDFSNRYTTLKALILSYSALDNYEEKYKAAIKAEEFLKNNRWDKDSVYSYNTEFCFVNAEKSNALFKLGKLDDAKNNLADGISFIDNPLNQCDSLTISPIITEYIRECREEAENGVKKNDINYCADLLRSGFSVIRNHPNFKNEYLYLIGSNDVFTAALSSLNDKGEQHLQKFIEEFLVIDNLVYNTADTLGSAPYDKNTWDYYTYYNLASYCWHAGIGHEALAYFQKAINAQKKSTTPDLKKLEEVYDYMYVVSDNITRDYPSSIKYKIQSLEASLGYYEHKSSEFFDAYNNAYLAYKIPIASSTSFELNMIHDDEHPHLDYQKNLDIIYLWRAVEVEIAQKFGDEYLTALHDYCNLKSNEFSKKNGGDTFEMSLEQLLPPLAYSFFQELSLNVFFNNISGYNSSNLEFQKVLSKSGWRPSDESYYLAISNIASLIEKRGYLDMAQKYLLGYLLQLLEDEVPNGEMIEKTNTQLAFMAWRAGNNTLLGMLTNNANQLSSREIGMDKLMDFYDVNELISQLVLSSRWSHGSDKELSKEHLSIAEKIIDDDVKCKNGQSVSNASKALVYSEIATVAKDYEEAEKYYEKITQIDTTWDFTSQLNLASIYSNNGRYEDAAKIIEKIDEYISSNYVDTRWRLQALDCKLNIAFGNHNTELIKSLLAQHLDYTKMDFMSKSQRLSNASRANYWDKNYSFTLELYTTYDSMCDENDAEVSYNAALFHKGILKRLRSVVTNNVITSDDDYLKRLYADFASAQRNNSDSLYYFENRFMEQYALHPEFLDNTAAPSWMDVKNCLGKKDVAIEYSLIYDDKVKKSYYAAIIIDNKHKTPVLYKLCEKNKLDSLIVYSKQPNGYSNAYDDFSGGINSIYELVWMPIEKVIKGANKIYFSPYAIINNINIECLCKTENSKPMFELYDIVRLSSTGEVINHTNNTISSAAVFGDIDYNYLPFISNSTNESQTNTNLSEGESNDPYSDIRGLRGEWSALANAAEEVSYISDALSHSNVTTSLYSKENGTEEAFKNLSSENAGLVHLATHGYYFNNEEAMKMDYFNPKGESIYVSTGLRSGILFSGANQAWKGLEIPAGIEDGILTADEVLGLDLSSTDLLILSACQTALGDMGSDGVYGIQRSFKIAGVNTIIMSLWEVDDEATKIMMTGFYDNLLKGQNKREAFTNAINNLRSAYVSREKELSRDIPRYKRYDSSYYWNSFIMLD